MTETIALFGATGKTGKEFFPVALRSGYRVKALVRDASKIKITNDNLTTVQGDFENEQALEQVLDGSNYVVCMAAATKIDGVYPEHFMLNFVQRLYSVVQKLNAKPKVFLYQAGSMSADANGFLHPVGWTMKQSLGRKFGIFGKIHDNDAVIRYIGQQGAVTGINFIVTRAGVLKEGKHEKEARLSLWVSSYTCIFLLPHLIIGRDI